MRISALVTIFCLISMFTGFGQEGQPKTMVAITVDQLKNGSIKVEPPIPEDGKVPQGAILKVTATPDAGFGFDSGYYALPGRWGRQFHESPTPTFEVVADRDKIIGASFIEAQALEGFTVRNDIVYAQPGVKKLKYDVFSPNGAKDLPIIVIIHGGGWTVNSEDVMRGLARELVRGGGYVVCSMDYRWMGNADGDKTPNTMADLIGDVFGCLAHIQEHAKEYGGDPARLGVTGDSAGGHLSAVAALMPNMIGDGGATNGVYEFKPTYLPPGKTMADVRKELMSAIKAAAPSYGVFSAQSIGGIMRGQSAEALNAAAPQNHIPNAKDRAVPFYLVRGTKDAVVSDAGVQSFADALKAAGQSVEYVKVEGAAHAFFDWKPDAGTKAAFVKYGVPYAASMKHFFNGIFYPQGVPATK